MQEIAALRQGILSCEGELRAVSSPAYTAKDRDRALAEQSVSTASRAPPKSTYIQYLYVYSMTNCQWWLAFSDEIVALF